jgi:hypothetical protein
MKEFSGGRLTAGLWLDPCQCMGLEASAFFLGQRHTNFTDASTSPGDPLLARPIIDTTTGLPARELISGLSTDVPGSTAPPGTTLTGRVSVTAASELWGWEANALSNLGYGPWGRWDAFVGFRYLYLKESLDIREDLLTTLPASAGGGTIPDLIQDDFGTHNHFYGAQIGLRHEWVWGRWQMDTTAKVALGETHEEADLGFVRLAGMPQTGLYVTPSNAGRFTRDRFGVIPQIGCNIGYQITDHWRAYVGYDFLFWNQVVRPGNVIDQRVNPGVLAGAPGATGPAFTFHDSPFWAQGVNFGFEFRY